MESDVKLTEYIDKSILQTIQEAFSDMTGLAALITNPDGTAVTEGSGFCRFCTGLNRKCLLGKQLCEYSDKSGAMMTHRTGRPTWYYCHAGLIDFSAPIVVNGEMIGCFVGGQALTSPPDEAKCKAHAIQLGLDPDEYFDAIREVNIVSEEKVGKAMDFLYTISGVLSDMAYGKYTSDKASAELERVSRMKSDFLANMSHEIRTPMNAVIGMAEMALREELPDSAREYISQIKSSGKVLLTIINDILDFSKIESGMLDIKLAEYEPVSLFDDVVAIIASKVIDKDVELILNLNTSIPKRLYGDGTRIRQILLNLGSNAVKFTESGQVRFVVDFSVLDADEILLSVSVEDTGIGIKDENLGKVFESFLQVDSKRNRSCGGTGLGLAISKELLSLMDGSLHVESEYKKGSVFSFKLPQRVIDHTPSMGVADPGKYLVIGIFDNEYLLGGFTWDASKLGVSSMNIAPDADLSLAAETAEKRNPGRKIYVFIEHKLFDEEKKEYFRTHPDKTVVVVTDYYSRLEKDLPNLMVTKKPMSAMNMALILGRGSVRRGSEDDAPETIPFTAPDAKVLIVEDNAVNLTVAVGLLEPFNMKISSAMSGKEAIRKIEEEHFDLILMDHMMPEMDGIETTRIIRRMYPDYDEVPIIALTANAVRGVREMFISEGMNDFVPKPIELPVLAAKLRQWLPPEKILTMTSTVPTETVIIGNNFARVNTAPELDKDEALKLLGSEKLFRQVIKEYLRILPEKAERIEKLYREENWPDYAVEIHGLKNASRQIGAGELMSLCEETENAVNARKLSSVHESHDKIVTMYKGYSDLLPEYLA
ncbi:MAG: PocR ligand-binding domain-containing protein [Lachnospiraceae bacterium]|nr:PocR ligand-binding domain-containing protein [Lachnospiraceae bacterium]